MGFFKSEAQKKFEHDQATTMHHIAQGRDPETARHGDSSRNDHEHVLTAEEAVKYDLSSKNVARMRHVGKGKVEVVFKRGKVPDGLRHK
jgi:hypothetical protein